MTEDISVPEIVGRLIGNIGTLVEHLLPNGRRDGREWRCGSVQGEPGYSLGVRLTGAKAGVWCDFEDGAKGDPLDLIQACLTLDKGQAVAWAKGWLGIGSGTTAPLQPPPQPQHSEPPRQDNPNQDHALEIWHSARPAPGTLTGTYLRHRAITGSIPLTIRDHPGLKHGPTGQNLPAMVAAITGADRKVVAVQRTFLRVDGLGKANVSGSKLSLGAMRDGTVHLGPAGPVLGIAEGIETGLSVMQFFGLPVWCSLSASRLDRLWLPPESLEIHVFGDNGTPGHEAAERAAKAYQAQGRRVVVRFPPAEFGDFNDVLSAEAAA